MTNRPTWMLLALCLVVAQILCGCGATPRWTWEWPGWPGQWALPGHALDMTGPPPTPTATATTPTVPVHPDQPVASRKWRHIVIHHSATDGGNAAGFDKAHRRRGWDELGYHFVIDNGRGGPDGRVETGSRWRRQKWGAHCGGTPGNEYNEYGIGICVVGRFDHALPSAAQLATLETLVADLATKHHIPPENVIGHRDAPGANTKCPGDALYTYIHTRLVPRVSARLARVQQ